MIRRTKLVLGASVAVLSFVACLGGRAIAGYYSYSNSLGTGQADTRVRNSDNSASDTFVTQTMEFPSSGFNTNIPLTVSGTWARNGTRAFSKIKERGVITNRGQVKGGDAIDSGDPTLDALVVPSSACASIELDVEPMDVIDEQNQVDQFAYQYLMSIYGSDRGTGLKVTWYDWLLDRDPIDRDDVIANGNKLAELLFTGPINLQNYDCIKVRSQRGREYIQVVTAGTAATLPFDVTCPSAITLGCNEVFRGVGLDAFTINGGVAPYTVTYDPPLDQLSDLTANTVTATVTDSKGCSADSCQFDIIRAATVTFSGFESPIGGMGGACNAPLRTIKRGSNLPVKFDVRCNGQPISTPPFVEVRNCVTGVLLTSGDAIQQPSSVWHYNIDSGVAAFANATLEITVFLPGGYIKRAYIKLKG